MVVGGDSSASSWGQDVVLLVEATANLFPFVESIKTNYIVPTLECFNGAPADDRDYGYDSIINCSYTLLTFTAADSAPDPACVTVTPPTSSIGKVLTAFDKLLFAGGAAEQCSHITEGLATALQVFEDLSNFKNGNKEGSKHCILVCNSPPYQLPVLETTGYQGQTLEQLAMTMQERNISLSIICPRKIPQLCKLFEKAGGDLMGTLSKNYAKDKRHLILPSGFTLTERPATPPPETRMAPASPRSPVAGAKRPAPTGNSPPREAKIFKQPGNVPSPQQQQCVPTGPQMINPRQQQQQPPTPPQLSNINQPNPPNVNIRQFNPDVRSPGGRLNNPSNHWNNPSPPVSTPSPTNNMSLLQNQLNQAPQMRPQNPNQFQNNQMFRPRMVGPQGQGSPGMVYANQQMMNPNMGPQQMNQPMPSQGPMNPQMPPNPNNQMPVPNNALGGPSNQMGPNNQMGPMHGHMQQQQQQPPQQQQPQQQPQMNRRPIWRGDIEFQDRANTQQKHSHKLQCIVFSQVNAATNEVEVNAGTWPDRMQLQLLPRSLLMNVMPIVKNAARCVFLNFQQAMNVQPGVPTNEQSLSTLCRLMSNSFLGFIHLTSPPCDIKVMIVVYMSDKNTFMGLIANEQDTLLNAIKQEFESHKRAQNQQQQQQQQQQQKNKMMMNAAGPNQLMGPNCGNMMTGMNQQQQPMMSQGPVGMNQMNPMGMQGPNNQMGPRMNMPPQQGMPGQNMNGPSPGLQGPPGMSGPGQGIVGAGVNQGGPMGAMNIGGNPQGMMPNQAGGGQPMMSQGGPGQQGMMGNQGPPMGPQGGASSGGQGADFAAMEAERKQNLLKIQQLQQTLELAQQKELQYKQQQSMPGPGGQPVPGIMGPGGPVQGGPRPMGPGPQLRGVAPQGPQNPQLRHLLQQQQQQQQQQHQQQMRAQMMGGPLGQPGPPQQAQQQQMYGGPPQPNQQYNNYNQQF